MVLGNKFHPTCLNSSEIRDYSLIIPDEWEEIFISSNNQDGSQKIDFFLRGL